MTFTLKSESTLVKEGWWKWSVWLDGTPGELDAVSHVVYYLHPTFLQPVREKRNRADSFRLESEGWGEFTVRATVHHADGPDQSLEHELSFGNAKDTSHDVLTLMISNGLADEPFARILQEKLGKKIKLINPKERAGSSGLPIDTIVNDSDVLLAVVSPNSSRWVEREVEAASKVGLPIISVMIGDGDVPKYLTNQKVLRMSAPKDASKAASGVVKQLQGQFQSAKFFLK